MIKGITIQEQEPTPDKPEKIISFMVDEEGEKYIKRLQKEIEGLNKELEEKEAILGGIQQLEAEIERLKKREQECIDHYLAQCKYASEMEAKYIIANNIINELEKWLDKKEKLTFNSWNKGIHEVQRKLQELKGDDKE